MSNRGIASLLVATAALAAVGCASQLPLVERSAVGGGPLLAFWPPPEPTLTFRGPATESDASLGECADRIALTLASAGYRDTHWYAIGANAAHGFAVSTRLEKTRSDDGELDAERWSKTYPEAANLFWLEAARAPRLPSLGSYRAFLVAFTDLPIGATNVAPHWNRETWMADADLDRVRAAARRVSPSYRAGVYVYEYAAERSQDQGAFVERDPTTPDVLLKRAGLSPIFAIGDQPARRE